MSQSLRNSFIVLGLILVLSFVVYGLGSALFPLLIAFGLAYLFFPLVKKLEAKGFSRSYVVIFIFSAIVFLLALVALLILPGFLRDLNDLINSFPKIVSTVLAKLENWLALLGKDVDLSKDQIRLYLQNHSQEVSASMLKKILLGIGGVFSGAIEWLLGILNFFLIPLFFFYVIHDYEKLSNEFLSLFPRQAKEKMREYMEVANRVLNGYIRGQILVALILAILYSAGLSLIGLPFGFAIGFISGFISIIPYAGFTIGFATALAVGLAHYELSLIIGIVLSMLDIKKLI